MLTVAIHQPQYLPYLGFFHKLVHCDVFIALDHVQYQSGGLQNRNKIKTVNGPQWLTVPVSASLSDAIKDVRIPAQQAGWARKHWQSLQTSYAKAPYFKTYAPELQAILMGGQHSQLCSVDMQLIEWAMKVMGINTRIVYSSMLSPEGQASEMLIALCRALGATRYFSGQGGKRYMELPLFSQAGIEIEWQQFLPPSYPQLFPALGFIPNLSVLDAIFMCGAEARGLLDCRDAAAPDAVAAVALEEDF